MILLVENKSTDSKEAGIARGRGLGSMIMSNFHATSATFKGKAMTYAWFQV